MAESAADLQNLLNSFADYVDIWKLKVNVDKTKIMVFSRGRPPANLFFQYNGSQLDIVNDFNYLGVVLSRTGSFKKAKQNNIDKATKALYEVLKLGRLHNLSVECQLDLFDKMVKPVLLYGCEIWGIGNNDEIERVQLKFCKLLLGLKTSTPSYMIYGELGRYPLEVDIKTRTVSFWSKLVTEKESKLSSIIYKLCFHLCVVNNVNFTWIDKIKSIFNECGMPYVWNTQTFINTAWLVSSIKLRLKDQFEQHWHSIVDNSPKALNYRLFKTDFKLEKYFSILDYHHSIEFCRFRTTNHKLPIEQGRWNNIDRNDRICTLCNSVDIGDEFHYVLQCNFFENFRKLHISKFYIRHVNILKFRTLMTSENKSELIKLCKFIKLINKGVCAPG